MTDHQELIVKLKRHGYSYSQIGFLLGGLTSSAVGQAYRKAVKRKGIIRVRHIGRLLTIRVKQDGEYLPRRSIRPTVTEVWLIKEWDGRI